ncbi:MAG TPA: FAD-dependent oxidoreductase [Candidatus Bathyarchaeia archaeon]|nr:FAD-dependent oxidoreductase [Candidatus Bathyarchaeia archaeon]
MIKEVDLAVIGGGPAGLAAAIAARKQGVRVLVVERKKELGGLLDQCIHDGFGLEIFKTSYTGPEYAQKYVDEAEKLGIETLLNTMVLDLTPERRLLISNNEGLQSVKAKAVILAMGCRERTREAIRIPGTRPSGVYTAGAAQAYINLYNHMPGERVVILGSGNVGLIMARRLTLEGAKVLAVLEILPYSSGLTRNIVQCLNDFGIPLYLSHTITDINGPERVSSVTVAKVDEKLNLINGTEWKIECDTILLSVGLIPENELSKKAGVELDPNTGGPVVDSDLETLTPGVFSCGNVLHVHDVVDFATIEAEKAGMNAAKLLIGGRKKGERVKVKPGFGVKYVVPQLLVPGDDVTLMFRVKDPGTDQVARVFDETGKVLRKAPLRRVTPAEMIRLPLKASDYDGAKEINIEVR